MSSAIEQAIRQICEEKGLTFESVIEAIESALAAAYRKDFGEKNQNIEAEFDAATGGVKVFDVKTVVEDMDLEELERLELERRERAEQLAKDVEQARAKGQDIPAVSFEEEAGPRFNPKNDLMISEARALKPDAELGEVIRTELEIPGDFGRMAAMTAKQVITQKLREAEREIVFNEFKEFEGHLINGTVQRREGKIILVDLGRVAGIVRPEEQVRTERYNSGDRMRFFVRQVSLTTKGPEILLSRTDEGLVRDLFEMEIPEVAEGVVEIKSIARDAGSRSKVAVFTEDNQIDPIGACIGQRGTRIQTIIGELSGEKVDIIEWNEEAKSFIANALSPAKIHHVEIDEAAKSAVVHVLKDQLSLAIGRGGQNVRLAAQLTGWKISISELEGGEIVEEADGALPENPESVEKTAATPEAAEETAVEPAPKEEVKEAAVEAAVENQDSSKEAEAE
ncbi:transcription termination factor NusA [Patescibacteria group bacterium]|nr:transcription termination factor NusA [Patescibacteria group bacterium]MBU1705254.1 transcription termination factor NusA [Patescibacteria group bacterium]